MLQKSLRENILLKAMHIETFFHKMSDYAHLIAKIICVPTAGFTVVILLAQVFFRYVLERPIDWYLEAVEIVYIWCLFMAIAIAFKDAKHIRFIFLFNCFKFDRKQENC